MSDTVYYIVCGFLILGVLSGIAMMSRVRSAAAGNLLSAACVTAAILVTLFQNDLAGDALLWICGGAGLAVGFVGAWQVTMIAMPQTVALLNGFGGMASALVATAALLDGGHTGAFGEIAAMLAMAIGATTFTGSMVAGGKLCRLVPQNPVGGKGRRALVLMLILVVPFLAALYPAASGLTVSAMLLLCLITSAVLGAVLALGVGGADMPITISLLNSLSGVASAVAGMALSDPLLVAVGGVVGASGLLLTRIMCRAINRPLPGILLGNSRSTGLPAGTGTFSPVKESPGWGPKVASGPAAAATLLAKAPSVIIIPGYGMALAQAQELVKTLADRIEAGGGDVLFAIHPVAGRMPGHMNVLLCEADVPYDRLRDMDAINASFADCDTVLVVGANDVINPAANTAQGTPIYGMPVLDAEKARHIIICNFDTKPGYAGVDNPLYLSDKALLMLGDARETLSAILKEMQALA